MFWDRGNDPAPELLDIVLFSEDEYCKFGAVTYLIYGGILGIVTATLSLVLALAKYCAQKVRGSLKNYIPFKIFFFRTEE